MLARDNTQNGRHVITPDRLATPDIVREELPDGSIVLHNRTALPDPLLDPLALVRLAAP